jgi:hypothetical protein
MLTRKGLISGRPVALAMIAALLLTTAVSPLSAAPAAWAPQGISATRASNGATDISSRRRYHHYRRRGSAAGAAFMGMAIGTIFGAIAAQQRREDCYDYGYCGPYYYRGPYYYGRPYYYPPY